MTAPYRDVATSSPDYRPRIVAYDVFVLRGIVRVHDACAGKSDTHAVLSQMELFDTIGPRSVVGEAIHHLLRNGLLEMTPRSWAATEAGRALLAANPLESDASRSDERAERADVPEVAVHSLGDNDCDDLDVVVGPSGNITHAHRTAMRRLQRGEPVGDLGGCLGALYLEGLIVDDAVGPRVTTAGLALLERAPTVRQERPLLSSKPFPPRWRIAQTSKAQNNHYEHTDPDVRCTVETWGDQVGPLWVGARSSYSLDVAKLVGLARDIAALLEWDKHERAVAAQGEQA